MSAVHDSKVRKKDTIGVKMIHPLPSPFSSGDQNLALVDYLGFKV
jgi:hypothetical protein